MEIRFRATGQIMTDQEFNRTVCTLPITPELLEQYGADPVLEGPQATTTPPYEYSYRNGVEQIDGKWYTKYSVGPVFTDNEQGTAAEQMAAYKAQKDAEQATSVRNQRTEKLKDCDWTQLADSPVDKAAWATYRQALRDVPTQAGFPWEVQWPSQPE